MSSYPTEPAGTEADRARRATEDSSLRSRLRGRLARRLLPRETAGERLHQAVRHLRGLEPQPEIPDDSLERPVFLLATGWRSGSTLLQRLCCSDGRTLVWGEPHGELQPLQRLAASIEFRVPNDWVFDQEIGPGIDLRRSFIANLYPETTVLRKAHRAFLDAYLREPAVARGFDRFGAKFVRMSAAHAGYLQWLYPGARFVFLVRHPLRAFSSYRGRNWFLLRPYRVDTPTKFFLHWGRLAESFVREADELGALLLRYEDLVADPDAITRLEEHLSMKVDREVLLVKTPDGVPSPRNVSPLHRLLCRSLLGDVCDRLGYAPGREERLTLPTTSRDGGA